MINESDARRALDFFHDALFHYENLVSVGLTPVRNAAGESAGGFLLEVRVLDLEKQEADMARFIRPGTSLVNWVLENLDTGFPVVPPRLPVPIGTPPVVPTEPSFLEILIEEGSEVLALHLDPETRPCKGGNGVTARNAASATQVGTLGGRVSLDGEGYYFLSCWHVLDVDSTEPSLDIIQPSLRDLGRFGHHDIATLHWGHLSDEVDVALGVMNSPDMIGDGTLGFRVAGVAAPKQDLPVKKYGRTTHETSGEILRLGVSVQVKGPYPGGSQCFRNQAETGGMTARGDSGALLVGRKKEEKNKVVGLTFAGSRDGKYSYHNDIGHVQQAVRDANLGELGFH